VLLWLLLIGRLLHARWQGRYTSSFIRVRLYMLDTFLYRFIKWLWNYDKIELYLLSSFTVPVKFWNWYTLTFRVTNYNCIYCAGIWYIGELLSGTYGIVSAHGLIVACTFIPGSITYLHGCLIVRCFINH